MTVRLVAVLAHPDDDSYLLGGTLLRQGRVEPTYLFATSGEAGPIAPGSAATRGTLGAVREGEQRAFLEAIGYGGAPARFLRHPGYHLPEVPFERLVGEAAAEAFRRARAAEGEPQDAYLRLHQAAYPRSDVDRFYAGVRQGGFGYGEEGRLFDLTGVPDERIAGRVDIRAVAARKWAAILRHRSRLEEHEGIPEPLRWILLDAGCFVQPFPPRPPGGPVAGDLLAGPAGAEAGR